MRKQVKAQVIGREGERWFQSMLPSEWVFHRPSEDFGIDGTVAIGDEHSLTAFEFGVQIKASNSWTIREGYLTVPSIPVDVLRYWAVRLLPTLLVAYDASNRTGYFAWVPELITLTDITSSAKATTTLKVPVAQRLDKNAWLLIKNQTLQYHRLLASALATTKVTRPLLGTVHALAQALRLLGVASVASPQSEDERMLLQLSEAVAHREVVTSLEALASTQNSGSPLQRQLQTATTAYRSLCSTFFHPFEDLIMTRDRPVAIWANEERMKEMRPQLMAMITDMVIGLTTVVNGPTE